MKNNKKYISPRIKVVEVKSEQALLQVCIVGGIYNAATSPLFYCVYSPVGYQNFCAFGVKGGASTGFGTSGTLYNSPS
jgi:hypothetical protein